MKKPFIIAEMSGNHNQSLERALDIVRVAAKAGVHALKIQTYTADTMTLDLDKGEFFIKEPKNLWKGKSLYKLYQEAYTPWEWHKPIFTLCKRLGIIGFSTPFDETAVDFLEGLNVPMYKISSFEIVDIPLIRKVASTGKPIIMSTGMATVQEIREAIMAAKSAGSKEITLLKCTSGYPASPLDSNLLTIPDMRKKFRCDIGISDHTLGLGAAIASIAFGSTVIEKHFTLSRAEGGVDAAFSMEPHEMRQLVEESKNAWQAIGAVKYGPTVGEKISLKYRRSLYVTCDIKAGEMFTKENIKAIRPGLGLPPKYYDRLLGKIVKKNINKGTPLDWAMVN
ncbi:pseudaminic acid synthase [Candidatus Saganbacteria bacterium]|nr:pseudaminic acid synthase [Candidatus Saganbacteria bacterium]